MVKRVGDKNFMTTLATMQTFIDSLSFHILHLCSELSVLTFLDLSNNKIVEIFDKNFMKSNVLQTLNMHHNRISKIAPKSFEKMLALKTLDISNNKLETFTAEMFNGNAFAGNKLRKLDLSVNLLTALKENLFALLLSLNHLDLSSVRFKFVVISMWVVKF